MKKPIPAQTVVVQVPLESLVPYARNARTHNDAQVAQIAASIREFGWTNPVLIDGEKGIIAGHGRVLAARKLGLESVPCIELSHLNDTQKRAYILADNRLALNAGWDDALLALEVADLDASGFDLDLLGFDQSELDGLLNVDGDIGGEGGGDDTYSRKIVAPLYEPKNEKPDISTLIDDAKAQELRRDIDAADIPDDTKAFLRIAADRHTVLHFRRIADFYAHSDATVQDMMERSALVIIDFNKAIENGFVALTGKLGEIADAEEAEANDA